MAFGWEGLDLIKSLAEYNWAALFSLVQMCQTVLKAKNTSLVVDHRLFSPLKNCSLLKGSREESVTINVLLLPQE